MKMFAGRDTDLRDVRSVVVRQESSLDWPYIEAHLADLADLKGDPTVLPHLRSIRQSCGLH